MPKQKLPKTDLTGQKFGYLTVVRMTLASELNRNYKSQLYYAICDCSNCNKKNHPVQPSCLRSGTTTSCGCRRDQYAKNTGSNNYLFQGHEDIRGSWWAHIKRNAKSRNLLFDITKEQIWSMYLEQNRVCKLSKIPIIFGGYSIETTASIDRINGELPYVINNVQLLHKQVNIMKNEFSQTRFLELCSLITDVDKGLL